MDKNKKQKKTRKEKGRKGKNKKCSSVDTSLLCNKVGSNYFDQMEVTYLKKILNLCITKYFLFFAVRSQEQHPDFLYQPRGEMLWGLNKLLYHIKAEQPILI